MVISIIVSSYSIRRLSDIRELLQSIKGQVQRNYELIYVTEGNEDLRQAVVEEAKNLGLVANVIHNRGNPGLAEARNIGASIATGEVLGFVDDDVVLDRRWSSAVETTFRTYPKAAGLTGPAYPLWVGEPAQWLPTEFDWLIGCTRWFHPDQMVVVRNCWGMNMAFGRREFEQSGGFSIETGYHRGKMAEDVEFSLRLKARTNGSLYYVPDMIVWNKVHPYRLSNEYIIERSRWIGHSRRHIRNLASGTNPRVVSFEDSLLPGVLRSLVFPRNEGNHSCTSFKRRYGTLLLATFSLLIGYLAGPRK